MAAPRHSSLEIDRMRLAATALYTTFKGLSSYIRVGRTPAEIDHYVGRSLDGRGAFSALEGYRNYPACCCVSVNEVAAHGVPGKARLGAGDLVTVDIAAELNGWKSDASWTFGVLPTPERRRRLLEAAWRCTAAGVAAARPGRRVGHIGAAIVSQAKREGCSVIDAFAGHAIGRELHEEPLVPHVGFPDSGELLEAGMVLNIEPIVTFGVPRVYRGEDGWGYITEDGAPTAQFELTVALQEPETRVLTLGGVYPRALGEAPPFY